MCLACQHSPFIRPASMRLTPRHSGRFGHIASSATAKAFASSRPMRCVAMGAFDGHGSVGRRGARGQHDQIQSSPGFSEAERPSVLASMPNARVAPASPKPSGPACWPATALGTRPILLYTTLTGQHSTGCLASGRPVSMRLTRRHRDQRQLKDTTVATVDDYGDDYG